MIVLLEPGGSCWLCASPVLAAKAAGDSIQPGHPFVLWSQHGVQSSQVRGKLLRLLAPHPVPV